MNLSFNIFVSFLLMLDEFEDLSFKVKIAKIQMPFCLHDKDSCFKYCEIDIYAGSVVV